MLQGVIFDLDGVIVDSHPAHLQAWRAFLKSLGKEVSEEQLLFVLEGRKREDILRHFLGDLSPEQLRTYGKSKEKLFRDFFAAVKPVAGVSDILEGLRRCAVPAAVASSGSRQRVDLTLHRLGLESYFKAILAGDDVIEGKPDPEIFYLAASTLRVDPRGVVVCEDSVAGISAAKRAGMKCVGIAADGRRSLLINAGADQVIPDFQSVRVNDLRQLFRSTQVSNLNFQTR